EVVMHALKQRMLLPLTGICLIALVTVASSQAAPDPGLVGQLTSKLGVTPEQATGGAGAIFGLAKTKMSPADFSKLSGVIPGMDKFLGAAPAAGAAAGGAAPAAGAAAGGAAPAAGAAGAAGANPAAGAAGALGGSAASAAGALGAAAPG